MARGGSYVPLASEATASQMLALARGVNKALAGETSNTRQITVNSGSTSYTLSDTRCRAGRYVTLVPMNASAANANWYVGTMTKDSLTIRFTSALSGNATFGVIWLGD